jgi:hypothetical protein
VLASASPAPLAAQGWREASLWSVGTFGRPTVVAAGAALSWRDRFRSRLGAGLALGVGEAGELGGRGELTYHFLLDPSRSRGTAVYLGGGLAASAAGDGKLRPFAVVLIGAEHAPGGRRGSFVEIGLGGGLRAALGMRWRKQNAPRR